mmetsp:Transcript_23819/g.55553  ORF Transcript_23819/g.55553 Transcript_23819/m.55553 type:complete len:235 (-) Transcript_23819:1573-2277(-)
MLADHQWHFFFMDFLKATIFHDLTQRIFRTNGLLGDGIVESTQPFAAVGELLEPAEGGHQHHNTALVHNTWQAVKAGIRVGKTAEQVRHDNAIVLPELAIIVHFFQLAGISREEVHRVQHLLSHIVTVDSLHLLEQVCLNRHLEHDVLFGLHAFGNVHKGVAGIIGREQKVNTGGAINTCEKTLLVRSTYLKSKASTFLKPLASSKAVPPTPHPMSNALLDSTGHKDINNCATR